ncbi:MAG: zinc ribbon domain-containing protein [Cuniculiplasma sp.]
MEHKARENGKLTVFVNPTYTSQKCSKCGYRDRNNREGSIFHCLCSNFELHADLSASRTHPM